jgi:hypothetical protein
MLWWWSCASEFQSFSLSCFWRVLDHAKPPVVINVHPDRPTHLQTLASKLRELRVG